MKDHEARDRAIANIKKLARTSVVERRNKKMSAAESPELDVEDEIEDMEDDNPLEEFMEKPEEAGEDDGMTEIIIRAGRPKPKHAHFEGMKMPEKRKPGRPKKLKL